MLFTFIFEVSGCCAIHSYFLLQGVIDTLRSLSKPGGTHENTLLLVMGDHGQTLNGDHGGGTAEEVICLVFCCKVHENP